MADARIQNVLDQRSIAASRCRSPARAVMSAGRRPGLRRPFARAAERRAQPNARRLDGHEIIQSAPDDLCGGRGARGEATPPACSASASAWPCMRWRSSPVAPRTTSSWRWRSCHLNVVGSLFGALCQRPGHPDRGRKADRRHRDRHGRRHHLDRRVHGRPSGPCRCGAAWAGMSVTYDISQRAFRPAFRRPNGPRSLFGCRDGRDGRRRRCRVGGRRWARTSEDSALRVPRSMLTRIIQARLRRDSRARSRPAFEGFAAIDVAAGRRAGSDRRRLPAGGHPRTWRRASSTSRSASAGRTAFRRPGGGESAGPDYSDRHRPFDGRSADHAARTSESRNLAAWAVRLRGQKRKLARTG